MNAAEVKTPEALAEEARRTGRDAAEAAQGLASEARAIGSDAAQSMRSTFADARATGEEALDTAKGLAGDAKEVAVDAVATGRAYAKASARTASAKLGDLKDRATRLKAGTAQYIQDEPVRASLYAMAGGAALMTLLLSLTRSRR